MSEIFEKFTSFLPGAGSGKGGRRASFLVLIAISTVVFFRIFTTYVPPSHFAVKESKYMGGIQEGVHAGGHLYFRGIGVTFHNFPKTWQILDFNGNDYEKRLENELEGYNNEGTLVIPSSEGFRNTFEMTVIYRITDPAIVIDKEKGVGMGRLYEKHVKTKAAPALKEAFGRLQAEELYDVDKRLPPAEEARVLMNKELNHVGIEVGQVLVRRFQYIPSYEEKISAKVLQRKLQIANEEQAKAATEAAQVRKINAEGQAAVTIEVQRADKERRIILSSAALYQRQMEAEGLLLVEQAEARGQELVNKAYEGGGSNRIVGIEMAKKASAIKSVYLTSCDDGGMNPLDLGKIVQKIAK